MTGSLGDLDADHGGADSRPEQLGRIRDPHFFHHIAAVGFDGLHADLQPVTDLFVLETGPD